MNRTVFRITGTEAQSFLQGLITNDVTRLDQGMVYAALLTPQGKYMADFLLSRDAEGAILLDVHSDLAAMLQTRLTMYKLRADVSITLTDLKALRGTGPAPQGALADPRTPELGWRAYGETEGDDGTDWDAIRTRLCIPETGIELTPDSYILECGFERLNGVDFRKGCYVGQEVTARMKHKTELKKGLVTLAIDGAAPIGTPIEAGGKPAGTLFTQSDGRAIAYLRFDRMAQAMQAGSATLSPL